MEQTIRNKVLRAWLQQTKVEIVCKDGVVDTGTIQNFRGSSFAVKRDGSGVFANLSYDFIADIRFPDEAVVDRKPAREKPTQTGVADEEWCTDEGGRVIYADSGEYVDSDDYGIAISYLPILVRVLKSQVLEGNIAYPAIYDILVEMGELEERAGKSAEPPEEGD